MVRLLLKTTSIWRIIVNGLAMRESPDKKPDCGEVKKFVTEETVEDIVIH